MWCSICKHFRALKFCEVVTAPLPYGDTVERYESLYTVKGHGFCVAYRKIVEDKDEYCERSNSIFDDEIQ